MSAQLTEHDLELWAPHPDSGKIVSVKTMSDAQRMAILLCRKHGALELEHGWWVTPTSTLKVNGTVLADLRRGGYVQSTIRETTRLKKRHGRATLTDKGYDAAHQLLREGYQI